VHAKGVGALGKVPPGTRRSRNSGDFENFAAIGNSVDFVGLRRGVGGMIGGMDLVGY